MPTHTTRRPVRLTERGRALRSGLLLTAAVLAAIVLTSLTDYLL